jgi:hypothetical protein
MNPNTIADETTYSTYEVRADEKRKCNEIAQTLMVTYTDMFIFHESSRALPGNAVRARI